MSNPDYIKVDSISEVDPNKLSLSFVGKKFIDKDNNRFSIRFNRETRKMEIVKIMIRQGGKIQEEVALRSWEVGQDLKDSQLGGAHHQLPAKESNNRGITSDLPEGTIHSPPNPKNTQPHQPKRDQNPNISEPLKSTKGNRRINPSFYTGDEKRRTQEPGWDFSNYDMDITDGKVPQELISEKFKDTEIPISEPTTSPLPGEVPVEVKWKDKNEKDKIDGIMKQIEEAKGRINSVLINIKSSRIFEVTGDPSENQNIIGNLTREFDVEVFQLMDATTNYLKELTSYPRAISYYTAKFERTKKLELANADDKQKLHMIIRWEMQEAFTKILEKLKALTLSLLNVLNLKTESHIKQLQYMNQLMFKDAKNATIYCAQDIEKLIQEVEDWKYKTMEVNDGTK